MSYHQTVGEHRLLNKLSRHMSLRRLCAYTRRLTKVNPEVSLTLGGDSGEIAGLAKVFDAVR